MTTFQRIGRRQLHTIISRETIRPWSPTPSRLQTFNLSPIDQFAMKTYLPFIFFYPKNANCTLTPDDKARVFKKSLSHTLTQYYPFAGRMTTPTTPYVNCNDHGVEFLEARTDTNLNTFLTRREQDETLYQLFANDLASYNSPRNTSLVGVQLNHFACGGVGLAVSMSHIVSDGSTLGSFLSHWAAMARFGSIDHKHVQPFNPVFLHSPPTDSNTVHSKARALDIDHTNLASRKFVFTNSKLFDLKNKVVCEAGGSINNPSRVEVLTSLLYKTAVAAATAKRGSFKPSYLFMMVNARDKFVQKLPPTTFGNFVSVMLVRTMHTSETSLSDTVAEMKKQKLQLEGMQSVQHLAENLNSMRSKLSNRNLENAADGLHWCSSLCGFPINKLDFGWGKPVGTTPALRSLHRNGFLLIDTPDGDGIEAWVLLDKERMEIFENDKELLSFCNII
ncbi:putative deacetylvindoline O-acetyltransferase [Helianthus annuus]|nr:putative deacetylvindoline O-acetyltransferase [Helianthus annuus]KAJ0522952.1 putative deacetylvindoline O-acetyltransferase [Helianthus annuus]